MIDKLQAELNKTDVDYFLVTNSVNLSYLLVDGSNSSERISGLLVVGQDKKLLLTSNFYRYYPSQRLNTNQIERKIYSDRQERGEILSELELKGNLLTDAQGQNYTDLKHNFPELERSRLLAKLRANKDDCELKKIRKACKITKQALQAVKDRLQPGITEIELALVADKVIRRAGSDFDNAFPTLVQSNSLQPHRKPRNKEINKHDLVIVDLGAEYKGYCCDMTRTFSHSPDQRAKRLVKDVKDGYELVLNKIEPGKSFKSLENEVKSFFNQRGYDLKQNYLHSLGHGVGLQPHEPPFVKVKEDEQEVESILKEGMVLAIEPALYLPDVGGIRLEDTILIKRDGKKEKLTSFPYRL